MSSEIRTLVTVVRLIDAGLDLLESRDIEYSNALRVIQRADDEGREPTLDELRTELRDLQRSINDLRQE